ncbi:unnamed protein product [Closterium sp. NIES-54]
MVHQVLQHFGFTYSSPQATPLSTRHSLSDLPSDESVESSGPYPELVGCLMYLMTCTRPDLAYPLSILARYVAPGRHRPEHMAAVKRVLRYLCSTSGMGLVLGGQSPVVLTGHADASWADDQAMQRSSQGYTFSLGSGSVSWWATRSSSVLGSSCEAEIYAGAMASQELCWLTYLLTDLGEPPRSPPVLYVDNKAMLALCREQKLEHRTKHIALRYFLARELQQRGQLRLAYVASEANTADESLVQQRMQLQSQQERVEEESRPHQERLEQDSHPQQQVHLQTQQERVEESRLQQERVAHESRSQQRVQQQPQQERAEEEPQEEKQGQVPSQQTPEEAERHRDMSPEPRRSRYRADGPFHLVLRSRVPPPPVLPQPPESSLTVLHDPLSDYLCGSRCVVSRVLSALVTHPTAPLSSFSALVTTVVGFASFHCLDYAAHLVSGPARSPSSRGAPVFPLEVLEDRLFELGFLAAAVPHLCAILLAPEGDSDALGIPIPHTHAEAVSGPWALYWIAAKEEEMASYRSTVTYVDAVRPPGANVVSGMWLFKVKRPPGAPPVFKAHYVARGFSQREGVDFFQTFAPTPKMTILWVFLHIAAQRDNELHSLDCSIAFL